MTEIPKAAADLIRTAAEHATQLVEAITDPLERAEACELATAAASQAQVQMKLFRTAAFLEARDTMSVDEIAEACGITRARVYQILAGR